MLEVLHIWQWVYCQDNKWYECWIFDTRCIVKMLYAMNIEYLTLGVLSRYYMLWIFDSGCIAKILYAMNIWQWLYCQDIICYEYWTCWTKIHQVVNFAQEMKISKIVKRIKYLRKCFYKSTFGSKIYLPLIQTNTSIEKTGKMYIYKKIINKARNK